MNYIMKTTEKYILQIKLVYKTVRFLSDVRWSCFYGPFVFSFKTFFVFFHGGFCLKGCSFVFLKVGIYVGYNFFYKNFF